MEKTLVQVVMNEVAEAAKEIAKKHGLEMFRNNASYSDVEVNVRLKFRSADKKAVEENKEKEFMLHAHAFGLEADDLHKQIIVSGSTFTIEGINPRKRKNSIMIKKVAGGKGYIISPATALLALGRKVPTWLNDSSSRYDD